MTPDVHTQTQPHELLAELSEAHAAYARLDNVLRKLNFFRAIGAARSELRHSDFMAFLLSPRQSHQLGDSFLKAFLSCAFANANQLPAIATSEVQSLDLCAADVVRERIDHIDIAIADESHRLGVIVENKVDTGEHDNQLPRYYDAFKKRFPRIDKIIGLYLSPTGAAPSDPHYIPLSYKTVAEAVDRVRQERQDDLGADLKVLLRHCSDLLRGEFMQDERNAELAWEIHRKFPNAVEYVTNNNPTNQLWGAIKDLISEAKDVTPPREFWGQREIWFTLPEWSANKAAIHPTDKEDVGWLFWLSFTENVTLWLGANEKVPAACQSLLSIANSQSQIFTHIDSAGHIAGWPIVWSKMFLRIPEVKRLDRETVLKQVRERWNLFHDRDLPKIRAALSKATGKAPGPKPR